MKAMTPHTLVTIGLAVFTLPVTAQDPAEFFEKKIRPVFAASCAGCHNAKVKTAGLDLSTGEGFVASGVPGDRILKAVSYEDRLKMPPQGKLAAQQFDDLAAWVKAGAVWPGVQAAPAGKMVTRKHGSAFSEAEKKFWAFQPVRKPDLPAVRLTAWPRSPIDRFILAGLETKGLTPAAPADKLTLLRRVTFDLTGLPPTEQEITAYLADQSDSAFAKVVDRLLESPRYGERWGRRWLDVARYADSTGNDEDHRYPYAWRYRDYVIDSFNRDVPYDQFIREQLAGDLLPPPDGAQINRRGLVATGFLALGAKAIAQQDKKKMLYDVYDEQVDVTSKAFLGLTLSCSRCHDHKFDPLLQRDYYSMINFFANTKSFKDPETHVSKLLYVPLVPAEEYKKYEAYLDKVSSKKLEIEDVVEGERERIAKELTPRLAGYMLAAKSGASAAEKGLDEAILAKWVKYLKFDWRQKPHLEAWSKATPETVASVAKSYQDGYAKQLEAWNQKIARWRETTRKMLKEMNMPPPPRPMFNAEEDGFFFDIYFERGGPFAISERDQEKRFTAEAKAAMTRLKQEQEELKKNAPPEPDMACGVEDEASPVKQQLFIRGDYNSLGEETPRAYPTILAKGGDSAPNGKGSGRLELANWIANGENPLTARVMANRIWQGHFGEGIVRTPDNFGKMGERPTHPELLDWLASNFVENGWSVKKLHREIVLSAAYQMSSAATPAAVEKDPENRLFAHFNRRRLDVEEIRDGLLAIDGSLDYEVGGTMQKGFGTDGENSQDRLSVNPDKLKRRTVYVPLRRANLPALLNLFDFGDATTTMGKRALTNVAPQALFMLNSEFLTERSSNLAAQVLAAKTAPAERMETAYVRTLGRKPAAGEVDAALTYVASFQQKYPGEKAEASAWQSLVRALMASNDFIYVD
jgi:cytochrome c553